MDHARLTMACTLIDTTDHDAVMSWLQDREMRDTKLGAARNSRARMVDITTAIGRLVESARLAFPLADPKDLEAFVSAYVDPLGRAGTAPRHPAGPVA